MRSQRQRPGAGAPAAPPAGAGAPAALPAAKAQCQWSLKSLFMPWRWFQRKAAAPQTLRLAGCSEQLDGVYQCVEDKHARDLEHSHPTYAKEGGGFFCYFWHDENDEESNGWYIADEVASEDFLAFNPAKDPTSPPLHGWSVGGKKSSCAFTVMK